MTPQVAHTRIVCTSAEGVGFNQSWTLEVVGGLREDVSHKEWEGLERTCRIWTGLPSPLRESLPRTDARTLEVGGYKAPPSDATTSYARPTARRFSGFAADDGPGMRTAGGQNYSARQVKQVRLRAPGAFTDGCRKWLAAVVLQFLPQSRRHLLRLSARCVYEFAYPRLLRSHKSSRAAACWKTASAPDSQTG